MVRSGYDRDISLSSNTTSTVYPWGGGNGSLQLIGDPGSGSLTVQADTKGDGSFEELHVFDANSDKLQTFFLPACSLRAVTSGVSTFPIELILR